MKAIKKINNNVVLAVNDQKEEVFVVGKGLGFKKTPFDLDDSSDEIEKVFVQKNNMKYYNLFESIPINIILLVEEIISDGKKLLGCELNEGLIISLSDHINGALERQADGSELSYTFQWEIKHIYPTEMQVGLNALKLIKRELEIQLPDSEASFIALHFVNAQLNQIDFTETSKITRVIKDILSIVKYHYRIKIDEESINYSRFVTHLRYFLLRLINNETLSKSTINLHELLKSDSTEELACIDKIRKYLKDNYNWYCSNEEKLYLIIHLQRMTKNL